MKRVLLYIGIVALIASCTKSEITENIPTDGEISFSAGVTTRVGNGDRDCLWADSGDEVGIFTNQTGEENLKFSVDKNGAMTSESKLYTLASGTRDYYAYHPYMEDNAKEFDKENRTISIDHTANQPNTPLLWASISNSNDVNVKFEGVEHMFKHQLVRVDFNFTAGGEDIANLTGITAATIKGANAKATFSIKSGEFKDNATGDISLNIADVKNGKIITYLIPTATVNGNVTLEITVGDKTFTTPITTASWVGNKKYKYNVTVGKVPPPIPVDYSDIATVNELLGSGYDDAALRLSNCYMVDPAVNSGYIIPVGIRINTFWSSDYENGSAGLQIDGDWLSDDTYTIEPLWNDFGLDSYDGQITFSKVTGKNDPYAIKIEFAESFNYEGNMVVAVKNGGTIVWSWHIWITDYNPYTKENGTTYDIDSDTEGTILTWMDRNIGALGTAYSTSNNLYYQWGRKDPLRAINDDSDEASAVATIADAVKAPEYFYLGSSDTNNDWCGGSGDENWEPCRDHHWRDVKLPSVQDSETKYGTTKSIYDPSPLGFMVPGSISTTVWSSPFAFIGKSVYNSDYSFSDNIVKGPNDFTLPASGCRNECNGDLNSVGNNSCYWSATPKNSGFGYTLSFNSKGMDPSIGYVRSKGIPVRPIKEFRLHD